MSSTTSRRAGLWLLGLIAIGLGGAFALSAFFRQRPVGPAGQHDPHDGTVAEGSAEHKPPEPLVKPPAPKSDYLGSASCAECHPDIARQYATHSMAKSMEPVATAPVIEDFTEKTEFTPDGRHIYSVEKTAEGVFHHERLLDSAGQQIYDQSVRMDFAVGSGAHGRSYLLNRQGNMFMSPISWYSKAQRWNLSPGYVLPQHRRFERWITDSCLDCHVGRMNSVRGWDNHRNDPPFLEHSIGCERCHGPGGDHVTFHREGAKDQKRDPIVNPADLDPARREDVCAQCHLQGEGRIPNYGCDVGDFRPGQRLEETSVVFVQGTRTTAEGTSRAVSHVDQTRSSTCYQKSAGKFGCISCHNPHGLPAESEKVSFYRQKCLVCHEQQGCRVPEIERKKRQPDDSCVACHMPPIGASDIPHTSHTDHRVLRFPSAVKAQPLADNALPEMFDNADQRLPQLAINRARGIWLAERAELKSNSQFAELAVALLTDVAEHVPDDADVLDALGTASAVAGKMENAVDCWKRALALEPRRDLTLRTLALVLQNNKRVPEAIPYFKEYLKNQPWSGPIWARYSRIQGLTGDWPAALEAAQKSEAVDPSMPRIYQWLSTVHHELGHEDRSRHFADLYERIKPPATKSPDIP